MLKSNVITEEKALSEILLWNNPNKNNILKEDSLQYIKKTTLFEVLHHSNKGTLACFFTFIINKKVKSKNKHNSYKFWTLQLFSELRFYISAVTERE